MVPSRRDALKTLPPLALGLAGCAGLPGQREDDLSVPTRWRHAVRNPTPAVHPPDGPVLVGSRSPFPDHPLLTALDPETGEERWQVPGEEGRGSPVAADGEFAYVFSRAETAYAVDYRTGAIAWEASVAPVDEPDPGVVQYAPLPLGETVVVPVSGTEDDVPDRLTGLARADGDPRFEHDLPASLAGRPDGDDAGTVAPLLDGTLRGVAPDGTAAWRVDLDAPPSSVTVADGVAYAGTAAEELLAVDAATGDVRWRNPLQNTVFTPPLVVDGTAFVGAADYRLYAFDAAGGERRWRTETANAVSSGPTMADGRLVTMVGGRPHGGGAGGPQGFRGPGGDLPREPTELYVHGTDGTRVDRFRFEAFPDGGRAVWAAASGDGVYLGQDSTLTRLDEVVLGAD